jgi:hypothetical protein
MAETFMVEIAELRAMTDKLFQWLQDAGIECISSDEVHYWTVFPDEAFKLDTTPEILTGNLGCDLTDVRSEVANLEDRATTMWHAFHHLSGLMTFIASADLRGTLDTAARA